jgi:EmrB/QacA subfamily drug resistance transporter
MSHRQVLEAMSGLLMGMFVAILSGTVVSTSLPRIISDLKGDQASYTWVVTATLLATTVSTPIWGKFSDLFSRKLLVQLSLVVFVLGSALAGFAQDTPTLIAFRVIQGLGAGGLTSLVQVILSDIISPRQRGRYMGYLGAVMAVGTAGGPLLGGLITDSIGWRFNFYVAIPFAIAAIILIQRTLNLPKKPARKVSIDYFGLALIAGGVSLLLIWVTLAGNQFEWASTTSFLMLGGAIVLLVAAVIVELKVKEPILPIRLFANRTFTLVVVASLSVGVALFGTSVFLAQYMQLSRGKTPTEAGLYTLPQIFGLLIASTIFGALISRTGKWKSIMITGASLLTVGLALMSTLTYTTPFWLLFIYMAIMGVGLGMVMQNLVLVVQNSVDVRNIGSASSAVAFFRSLGGTIGVSVLGAVLGTRVSDSITQQVVDAGVPASDLGSLAGGTIPELSTLTAPVRTIVENAYGQGVGEIFLIATPLALITLIAIIFLPKSELGTKTGIEQLREKTAQTVIDVSSGDVAATASVPVITPEDVREDSAARETAATRR